ncbi:hypothetical protein CLU79DRAFT_884931 [Phycomyces nitens]|nr:hypothetical protein CLU79DRAFT_884931 [Phycomyces nitens]
MTLALTLLCLPSPVYVATLLKLPTTYLPNILLFGGPSTLWIDQIDQTGLTRLTYHVLDGVLAAVWKAYWRQVFDNIPFTPVHVSDSVDKTLHSLFSSSHLLD